ncbi:unnamed protein product [Mytilus coruscus]|uniref:MRC n=1 Tax=Mytilus coruscus TaxID=42192 RepID=A0A6J8CFI6_MYTCO|nr:unnamed protein product [Mytilus coruscus]
MNYYETSTVISSARSPIECAVKCNEISSCTFYSYNVVDEICFIHSTDIYDGQMKMQTDSKWRIYEPEKACLKGWNLFKYYCYYFSKDEKNWTDAKSFCQSKASFLAEVVSSDQRDFLKTKADESEKTYWLGGTDIVTEGIWMWTTSQTLFTFTDWNDNNPSNDGGSEHCLEMRYQIDYKWNDNYCDETCNYICQGP